MSAERGTCSSPELIIAIIDDRTENSDQRVLEVFPLVSSYLVIAAVLGENAASVRVKLVSWPHAAGPGDSWLISPNKFRGEARVVTSQLQAVPAVRQGTGGGDIQHVDLCCYVSRILDLDLQGL